MHVLIVLDTRQQQFSHSAEVYYALDERGWKSSPAIPFTFWKEFNAINDTDQIGAAVQEDVDAAAIEADWIAFNYMYVSFESGPSFRKATNFLFS